jgi:hypothetical protein
VRAGLDDMHAEILFAKPKSRPSVLGDVAFRGTYCQSSLTNAIIPMFAWTALRHAARISSPT